ncbi:hypothetical protein, partial [Aeromonas veronii]|uniref:hypothetical protein n=1 Tax=Aeromonas veronii TaxID=654 RepID=UPI003BA27482
KLGSIAGVEEIKSLVDTHKKSETNQQVSDFHTSGGSVNGSLTDRHYPISGALFIVHLGELRPAVRRAPTRWRAAG